MKPSSEDWKVFYQHSLELFQFLEQNTTKLFLENERSSLDYAQDTYGIVTSAHNAGYVGKVPMAPRFMHTICQLNTEEDLASFQQLLQQYQALYLQAAGQTASTARFPFLMPRLLAETVYQININSSKAFMSKAHHPKDGPLTLKTWSYSAEDYSSFETAVDAADEAVRLVPPVLMSLEYAVEFIDDDELVEITPKSIRLRKRFLKEFERKRASRELE